MAVLVTMGTVFVTHRSHGHQNQDQNGGEKEETPREIRISLTYHVLVT